MRVETGPEMPESPSSQRKKIVNFFVLAAFAAQPERISERKQGNLNNKTGEKLFHV